MFYLRNTFPMYRSYVSRSWTVHTAMGVLVSMTSEIVNVIREKKKKNRAR